MGAHALRAAGLARVRADVDGANFTDLRRPGSPAHALRRVARRLPSAYFRTKPGTDQGLRPGVVGMAGLEIGPRRMMAAMSSSLQAASTRSKRSVAAMLPGTPVPGSGPQWCSAPPRSIERRARSDQSGRGRARYFDATSRGRPGHRR